MTWEDVFQRVVPVVLLGLGGIVLKLWRSQAVTEVLIRQIDRSMASLKEDMKTDTGEIKADVKALNDAFNNFVRKNGGK